MALSSDTKYTLNNFYHDGHQNNNGAHHSIAEEIEKHADNSSYHENEVEYLA